MTTAAKKASPRKAAAKQGPAKPARAPKTPAGTAEPAPPPAAPKSLTVAGREVRVKRPTAEQLVTWETTISDISKMEAQINELEKIRVAIERFYEVCSRLFVDTADREWLIEAREEGDVSLEQDEILFLVPNIAELYKEEMDAAAQAAMNRAQKRAAARKKA